MMSDAFFTPAAHAFDHPELDPASLSARAGPSSMGDALSDASLEEAFEVDDTVERILKGGYKTIGLQFPDELLPNSVAVFKAIQRRIGSSGAQAYVLADGTYGSCCPDVLSCLHLPADFLVHYGHACLTPSDALPVHYVFPRRSLDINHALECLVESGRSDLGGTSEGLKEQESNKGIIVVWEVAFDWLSDDITKTFPSKVSHPMSFATIRRPGPPLPLSQVGKEKAPALRSIVPPDGLDISDCVIWYIGEEGRALLNLQMTHAANALYSYSPISRLSTAIHPKTSRLLSRRLYALHQAMSSDIFGLIVGNVGLASSKELLDQIRRELQKARKKSYTLSVGRLNPAKLANFETIECFVIVGCAEGGVVDSKDFLRPIITPWELLLALKGPGAGWDPSKWTLDFGKVLEESSRNDTDDLRDPTDERESSDLEGPEFSLVTGTYRTRKVFGQGEPTSKASTARVDALTLRNKDFSLAKLESAGSHYLSSRSFQGLEPRYGLDEPASLEEGRSGTARGYTEEK